MDIVPIEKADDLDPANYNTYEEYIKAQYRLWLDEEILGEFISPDWRIALGDKIKEHLFFQNLLKTLKGKIHSFDIIFTQLEKVTRALKSDDMLYKVNMLSSLLALVSEARINMVLNEIEGS